MNQISPNRFKRLSRRDRTISSVNVQINCMFELSDWHVGVLILGFFKKSFTSPPKKITCPLKTGDHFKRQKEMIVFQPSSCRAKHVTFRGSVMVTDWILPIKNYSWWFQPIWKILVNLDHFPKWGWEKKIFETTTQFHRFFSFSMFFSYQTPPPQTQPRKQNWAFHGVFFRFFGGFFCWLPPFSLLNEVKFRCW